MGELLWPGIILLLEKALGFLSAAPAVPRLLGESFREGRGSGHTRPSRHQKSPLSLTPFSAASLPPLSPGGCPRPGEPLTFCPLPTLLDHILCFYSGHLLAGEGKGRRLLRLPAPRPLLALLCPATVPLPPAPARPVQAGAGPAGFYFRLNIDGEG